MKTNIHPQHLKFDTDFPGIGKKCITSDFNMKTFGCENMPELSDS